MKIFQPTITGSIDMTGSFTVTGSINGSFTGSLLGTATTSSFIAQSDLRTLGIPYVIYTDYTPESTTSNSSTNALTTFTLTIADADWPLGGVLRLSGLAERTAGTGNTTTGITINGSTARYFTGTGTNIQWEWQIMKEAASTLRIGMGPSNTGNGSYQVHNAATVTATASGGNYVFTFYMFAVTAGATATMRWMKGLMIP
jgi:hypothetical protein